jgi:hypothetical protein
MLKLPLTVLLLLLSLPLSTQATPRYDELMCEEVAEAVQEAVCFGTLTQAEADHISDNCYALYD